MNFFARRMDTRWTDFFWSYRTPASTIFDEAAINLFWVIALVSVEPEGASEIDVSELKDKQDGISYTAFHDRGLLTRAFADNLISLLEAWRRWRRQPPTTIAKHEVLWRGSVLWESQHIPGLA